MVMKATVHMCQFGMMATDENGTGHVKKPTTMMTNSVEIHRELDRQCTPDSHRHVQVLGGRAKHAAIYPKGLCRAVCRGTVKQMEIDAADMMSMECLDSVDAIGVDSVEQEEADNDWKKYWDDMNGKELDPKCVQEARARRRDR